MADLSDAMELDDATEGDLAAMTDTDSDWEYEYDDEETEDFYVTLDLTTHVAPMARNRKNQRTTEEPNGRACNLNTPAPDGDEMNTPLPSIINPDTSDRIQIIELHSTKPLVSFHNKLYTCQWASPIGTDMLFHLPPSQPAGVHPPHSSVYSASNFSLLAASSLRLIAKPAKILPKAAEIPMSQQQAQSQPATTINTTEAVAVAPQFATQIMRAKQSQLTFLTNLAALKSSRGNLDAVSMGRGAELVPEGADGASDDETESGEYYTDDDGEGNVIGSSDRRRGRGSRGRSNGGIRRALGGLFRDYRPEPGDTPGADLRSVGEDLQLGEVMENPPPARGSRGGRLRASGSRGGGHGRGRGRGRGNGRGKWRKSVVQAGKRGESVVSEGTSLSEAVPKPGLGVAVVDPALEDHGITVEGGGQAVAGGDIIEQMQVDSI